MAKNMARVENNVVINIEWFANTAEENEILKDISDLSVTIGDTFDGEYFYHDGEKILTPLEKANAEIMELKKKNISLEEENATLLECILEMSEVVYA